MKLHAKTIASLLTTACLASACGEHANVGAPGSGPARVTVAAPSETMVSDVLELDGVVSASASVNLVARVAGFLQAATFREGEPVRQGQTMFVIEPAPYREQVKLNQARLDQARAEAGRQETLVKENATSQSSMENARSQMQQAEVNLRLAQINLDYTEVKASFDGVVGRRLVDVGNFVGATPGGTILGTIQKVRPAYIGFAISERDLLRLRARLPADPRGVKSGVGTLPVRATLQGEKTPSAVGVLDFIDNSLNSGTGTMQLRAQFPNQDLHLIPGLYAKVSIATGAPRKALLLPEAVLQADQQGSYVYVVDEQDRARRRNVRPGEKFARQREISEGLTSGDRVVIDGLANVSEGQPVQARAAGSASTSASTSASSPATVAAAAALAVERAR